MKPYGSCLKRRPGRFVIWLGIVVISLMLASCDDEPTCPCGLDDEQYVWETHRIRDVDYVKNTYFFLDSPSGPSIRPDVAGNEGIEVFLSVTSFEIAQNPDWIPIYNGKAFVDSSATGQDIDAAMQAYRDSLELPDHEARDFRRLELNTDFRYILYAQTDELIGIELIRAVPNDKILAVRYINIDGDTIGDYGVNPKTVVSNPPVVPPLIAPSFFELIKPRDPRPDDSFGYTWPFMMRNHYNLGLLHIDYNHFSIAIEDLSVRPDKNRPDGETVPYLRIFGLDRYDRFGQPVPDDQIDLSSAVIDLWAGILTVPVLRAFDPPHDSVAAWCQGDATFIVPDDYNGLANPEIYDDYLNASDADQVHKYDIVVKVRRII